MKEQGAKLDALPDFIEQRAAKDFMNTAIVDALGLKSFFFTLKLERAGHRAGHRADLRALVEDDRAALAKACGEGHAGVFARRLDKLPG